MEGGAGESMWEGMEVSPTPGAAEPQAGAADILAGFSAAQAVPGAANGGDLLSMFNASAAEPADAALEPVEPAGAAPAVDPVQAALQKALHVRKAEGSAPANAPPTRVVGVMPVLEMSPSGSLAGPAKQKEPDAFGLQAAKAAAAPAPPVQAPAVVDPEVSPQAAVQSLVPQKLELTATGRIAGVKQAEPDAFGLNAAAPAEAPADQSLEPAPLAPALDQSLEPAPALPAAPPAVGNLDGSLEAAPAVVGWPAAPAPAPTPVAVPGAGAAAAPVFGAPPPVAAPAPAPGAVPTAADYLSNLRRQQEAQMAAMTGKSLEPEPEPAVPPAAVTPAAPTPATAAGGGAPVFGAPPPVAAQAARDLPIQPGAAAPVQTELSLSTLNFPMEAVCLKRTLIREGFELSSPQCGQLEPGDKLTVIEGLEGQMGHNTILRVRFDRGWVTMRGVDGQQIIGPPDSFVEVKMKEAVSKLQNGEYKKAAMVFSAVLERVPDHAEANAGLKEAHKGIKFLMMSADDVNGAAITQTFHQHLGLPTNQGGSDESDDDDRDDDDSVATFSVTCVPGLPTSMHRTLPSIDATVGRVRLILRKTI
eukprot:COSAG02_NODE_749_length_17699_cov_13.252727_7_plen_588_part_00